MSLALLSLACLPGTLAAVLELPVRIFNGYSMVDVEVGTPAVAHSLAFDTGSATTWMISADCDNTADCPNNSGFVRTGYNVSSSSTATVLSTTASIDYLGGVTSGEGLKDVFAFPGSPNTTWEQTFLVANESSWSNIPADGFLGLAFSTIADGNTTTLVETLLKQDGLLDQPRFALYYGTELNDTGATAGSGVLTLGASHEDVYVDGNLTWTELDPSGSAAQLWRADMQYLIGTQPAAAAGNSTTTTTSSGTQTSVGVGGSWAVFDTGAGRISVPDLYVDDIYASIGMNYTAILNGDVIPLCEDFTDAWSVAFYFGNAYNPTTITLTGDMLKQPGFATGEDKYCWPPFDTSGSNGLFLMGADYLQKFYTVFDFGAFEPDNYQARVGFGLLKEEYRPY